MIFLFVYSQRFCTTKSRQSRTYASGWRRSFPRHACVLDTAEWAAPSLISFKPKPNFEPIKLIALIQKDGRHRLHGEDKVEIERPVPLLADRIRMMREFFYALA